MIYILFFCLLNFLLIFCSHSWWFKVWRTNCEPIERRERCEGRHRREPQRWQEQRQDSVHVQHRRWRIHRWVAVLLMSFWFAVSWTADSEFHMNFCRDKECMDVHDCFCVFRITHTVAERGTRSCVIWQNIRHLAPSPWLLAAGWHRNVSLPVLSIEVLSCLDIAIIMVSILLSFLLFFFLLFLFFSFLNVVASIIIVT